MTIIDLQRMDNDLHILEVGSSHHLTTHLCLIMIFKDFLKENPLLLGELLIRNWIAYELSLLLDIVFSHLLKLRINFVSEQGVASVAP